MTTTQTESDVLSILEQSMKEGEPLDPAVDAIADYVYECATQGDLSSAVHLMLRVPRYTREAPCTGIRELMDKLINDERFDTYANHPWHEEEGNKREAIFLNQAVRLLDRAEDLCRGMHEQTGYRIGSIMHQIIELCYDASAAERMSFLVMLEDRGIDESNHLLKFCKRLVPSVEEIFRLDTERDTRQWHVYTGPVDGRPKRVTFIGDQAQVHKSNFRPATEEEVSHWYDDT